MSVCTRRCSCAAAARVGTAKYRLDTFPAARSCAKRHNAASVLPDPVSASEDDEPRTRPHGSDDGLRGSWRCKSSEVAKVHHLGSARRLVAKADHGSGVLRTRMGGLVVVEAQRIHIVKEAGIGADPVRECCKPRNEVMEPGLVRKGSPSGLEGRLEPASEGDPHLVRFITPVVVVYTWSIPVQQCRVWRSRYRSPVMGEHGQDEGLERIAPLRHFPYLGVKRMRDVRVRETKEIPNSRTCVLEGDFGRKPLRPALGLESWMEFADVVQERERGQSLAVPFRQLSLRCGRHAIGDNGDPQQAEEDSRYIHRVMRKRMLSSLFVRLAPGGEPHACRFSVR